jgi:hypothetical protein
VLRLLALKHIFDWSFEDVEREDKSRMVELAKGGSFTFLGFEYRRLLSCNRVWRPYYAPNLKKRTTLLARLREVFRRNVSQPVGKVFDARTFNLSVRLDF